MKLHIFTTLLSLYGLLAAEPLSIQIKYSSKVLHLPTRMENSTFLFSFDPRVKGVTIDVERFTTICCWVVCDRSEHCVNSCDKSKKSFETGLNESKLFLSNTFYRTQNKASCAQIKPELALKVMNYSCSTETLSSEKTGGRQLFFSNEVVYVKCNRSSDKYGCAEAKCLPDGDWSTSKDCLYEYVNGICSNQTVATTEHIIPERTSDETSLSPDSVTRSVAIGTSKTTNQLSSGPSSSTFSTLIQQLKPTKSLDLVRSSILSPSFGEYLITTGRASDTATGEPAMSIIYTNPLTESEVSKQTDVSVYLSSLSFLTLQHLSFASTESAAPSRNFSAITPTQSSIYQTQFLSPLANKSDQNSNMISSSCFGWSNSSYFPSGTAVSSTSVPGIHSDGPNTEQSKEPDSKVPLGIVISVFVIIVAVLLVMIFRVVYCSPMDEKDDEMPRATVDIVTNDNQHGIEIQEVQIGNPFYLNINGDFSESNTDDDVSNGSDKSFKNNTNPKTTLPFSPSNIGGPKVHTERPTNVHLGSFTKSNQRVQNRQSPSKVHRLSSSKVNQNSNYNQSASSKLPQTTFSNETGCFKVSRLHRTDAIRETFGPSNSTNGDVYAVSYKQKQIRP